jgi:hypothetical protein
MPPISSRTSTLPGISAPAAAEAGAAWNMRVETNSTTTGVTSTRWAPQKRVTHLVGENAAAARLATLPSHAQWTDYAVLSHPAQRSPGIGLRPIALRAGTLHPPLWRSPDTGGEPTLSVTVVWRTTGHFDGDRRLSAVSKAVCRSRERAERSLASSGPQPYHIRLARCQSASDRLLRMTIAALPLAGGHKARFAASPTPLPTGGMTI